MNIAIIGTGGVGGYFGAKLAQAGNNVTFLARGAHLEAIQKNGLTVKSINGDFKIEKANATNNIAEIGEVDFVLIAVKAWQVKEIAQQLLPIIGENTIVVPLQNGVLAYDEITEAISNKNVLGGMCRIISKIEAPGSINHFAVDPIIVFGEMEGGVSTRVLNLQQLFEAANVNAKASKDIQADLWKKFISICVSGLLAVSNSTYGQISELPETHQTMTDLFQEVYQLSQKMGINIAPDYVRRTVAFIDSFPYDSTSSLTRDVWEGKPSEIEYQNGTVVKLAEKFGLEVPINKMIYHCILPQEKKARSKMK